MCGSKPVTEARRPVTLAACTLVLLGACSQPATRVPETAPPPVPVGPYEAAAAEGANLYRVDPADSLILVRVGRAGPMQRLGHDHAVASEDVRGLVAWFGENGRSFADFAFAPRELVVDRPVHRERVGLDAGPGEDDIRGTYDNMLKVLEPDAFPWVSLHASSLSRRENGAEVDVTVTLHGRERTYRLPVAIEHDAGRIAVSGTTTIRHGDFDLEPYSAAGGLLRVADELEIDFRIVAFAVNATDQP
jgi:hypothetical protein